jgi:hypothetical protein
VFVLESVLEIHYGIMWGTELVNHSKITLSAIIEHGMSPCNLLCDLLSTFFTPELIYATTKVLKGSKFHFGIMILCVDR